MAGQFENPANPDFHYETTAREIFEQMDGRIDAVVLGSGTAGTFTGVARFVKERMPKAVTVVVETQGSVLGGGKPGPHKVEGIGASFIPKNFDTSVCDEIMAVSDDEAFGMVKELAAKEGVLAGSSGGAAVFAALRWLGGWDRGSAWSRLFRIRPSGICRRRFLRVGFRKAAISYQLSVISCRFSTLGRGLDLHRSFASLRMTIQIYEEE